jgi:hypothetical protein
MGDVAKDKTMSTMAKTSMVGCAPFLVEWYRYYTKMVNVANRVGGGDFVSHLKILYRKGENILVKSYSIRKKVKNGNLEILYRNRENIYLKSYSMCNLCQLIYECQLIFLYACVCVYRGTEK